MQPINYMLDVQNPVQTAVTGLTQGMQIGQFVQAKEQAEREAIQKQQMQQELSAFASKPNKTHDDYASIMAKYPALAEDFKRSYDVLDSGKQQATFKTASRIYAATASKRFDLAKSILENEAVGYENSGDKETAGYLRQMATMAETDPEGLQTLTGLTLASTNPSQFKDVLGALNQNDLTPFEIENKQAQTGKAKAETEKTETETLWYGDKTQAEIDNIESQIEDRKTGRVLEQQKMQLDNDQFYSKLDQDQQQFYEKLNQEERKIAQTVFNVKEKPEQRMERLEKVEGFATAARNASEGAKLAAQLANDAKALNESTGGYWNRAMRNVPGTAEYTFDQKLETMKSKIFLAQVDQMRGLGALTESEGAALKASIASINPNQDPKTVQESLTEVAKQLSKAAQTANKKSQIYATKGKGYSAEVVAAAKARGVSPAEMQQIANQLGID
ncbi:hypothetical protein [Acinetobacter variabilis]|uniref:Uncharacterized protein n=1 Tax=Acinetobacter variabilis TaxID=70346 RepID=N9MJX0_9GAMM|nr:hypothetical protein [Acinetobacter variabilis]ENX08883.1 hypothetical protein F897_02035 [Acinetobacter variabilis]UBI31033.1 hypothetical protein LA331_02340 [Acinetobacter variabilis]